MVADSENESKSPRAGIDPESLSQHRAARTRGLLCHTAVRHATVVCEAMTAEQNQSGSNPVSGTAGASSSDVTATSGDQATRRTSPDSPLAHSCDSISPLVRLLEVRKTFTMGEVSVDVLRGITMEIATGELLVVEGPSGSGKTTLLNIIGGLDQPTAGEVWFQEQNLSLLKPAELTRYRRDQIGFVFQFYNLISSLTVYENVLAATEVAGRSLDIDELLDWVGLSDRKDHFPGQLSGGEQQRAAIARAVAKDPKLLLCDEPTGALDFNTGKKVLALLRNLQQRLGTTIVIVTHNTAISAMADRLVRIRSGQIVYDKPNPHPIDPDQITW